MLAGNFFDIQSFTGPVLDGAQQQYTYVTRLDPAHPVYQGHFPGNPVVPGVCQVQMVKELVENATGRSMRLTSSDNIKFLSMINPGVNPRLDVSIVIKPLSERQVSASAAIGNGTLVFLKFRGTFDFV
jgi:3-hydroxyacyl-[acyl-carrier-protein] dehydratase